MSYKEYAQTFGEAQDGYAARERAKQADKETMVQAGIHLPGRTDSKSIRDLVRKSGIFTASKLPHTPFLAAVAKNGRLHIVVVPSWAELSEYPDVTPVCVQWRGEWRSDFFTATVGELRAEVEALASEVTR